MNPVPVIPNAPNYSVDAHGSVVRQGRPLRRYLYGKRECVHVRLEDGRQKRVYLDELLDAKPVTVDSIPEELKTHPRFPDYGVSSFGAIYRTKPLPHGRRAGKVYLVSEFVHKSGKRYVSLRDVNGKRHQIPVSRFTQEAWGRYAKEILD